MDIGGGGEGVIGRLYTSQVVAIDNRQDELDGTAEGFEKILMDATRLTFEDSSFDHVTSFYTLMYMRAAEQENAIAEAARVLKNGGKFHIWDCGILSAYPEPFCVDVEIQLPNECISATYGVVKLDTQDEHSLTEMCLNAGLSLVNRTGDDFGFYLCFEKS